MIFLVLIAATFITSLISGVLSMAGGIILMGVFGLFLTVPAAMVLHSIAQAVSNGSRVWLYRHYIEWRVLNYYSIGAFSVLIGFTVFRFVPNAGLVFLLIGSFPFISLCLPKRLNLEMRKPWVSFSSGIAVTLAQMFAGASGPVLDIFYIQSRMTKETILGTKALTQTLGHFLKLAYYSLILSVTYEEITISDAETYEQNLQGTFLQTSTDMIPPWMVLAVVAAAIIGNYAGSQIVKTISDTQFKEAGKVIIILIGIMCIAKGLSEFS